MTAVDHEDGKAIPFPVENTEAAITLIACELQDSLGKRAG